MTASTLYLFVTWTSCLELQFVKFDLRTNFPSPQALHVFLSLLMSLPVACFLCCIYLHSCFFGACVFLVLHIYCLCWLSHVRLWREYVCVFVCVCCFDLGGVDRALRWQHRRKRAKSEASWYTRASKFVPASYLFCYSLHIPALPSTCAFFA